MGEPDSPPHFDVCGPLPGPGVTVLIKGSRVNRLERVVQALVGGAANSGLMMRVS